MKVFEGVDHYFENGFGGLHGDEEFCPALTHEKHKQRLQSRTTEYNLVLTSEFRDSWKLPGSSWVWFSKLLWAILGYSGPFWAVLGSSGPF